VMQPPVEDVELPTLEWVAWYSFRRFHSACNNFPPVEYELMFYSQPTAVPAA